MGKIAQIFNFDNIGGKIKNLAKWSCWIAILLIWIAAPISFIALVAEEYTAELCWIPLVSAIVGPVFVWISSWAMYAFGEFVEDIHAIRDKEGTTKEASAKRKAEKKIKHEVEEIAQKKAQIFSSPKCSNTVKTNEERWAQEIKTLSIEELKARSEDDYNWTEKYRELCHEELKTR